MEITKKEACYVQFTCEISERVSVSPTDPEKYFYETNNRYVKDGSIYKWVNWLKKVNEVENG